MRARHLAFLVLVLGSPALALTQAPTPPPQTADAAPSSKVWAGRHAEFENFLRTAPFKKFEDVPIGVTRPRRGYFAPGGLAASAAWKVLPPGRPNGYWESYKSEIAAYELDKLLGMDMVPPVVEKRWDGERGAAVLWIEGVRSWKSVEHEAKPPKWNREAVRMKMFDNLIGNIDRNAGNLLVDAAWNLYLIDHSRAFVTETRLRSEMQRIDQPIWERMAALDERTLSDALGDWVERGAIKAMLKRRELMQKAIDAMLKRTSEAAVFIR